MKVDRSPPASCDGCMALSRVSGGVDLGAFSPAQPWPRRDAAFSQAPAASPTLFPLLVFFQGWPDWPQTCAREGAPSAMCKYDYFPCAAFREHKRPTGRPASSYTGRGARTVGLVDDRTRKPRQGHAVYPSLQHRVTIRLYPSLFFNISFTFPGFAFPPLAFITCPTRKPKT